MSYLVNKRILLICPRFFGYEHEIKDGLQALGARVDWMADRPFKSHILRAFATKFSTLSSLLATSYYKNQLQGFESGGYDFVFVVNGQTVSTKFLKWLRCQYPSARYILYLWDSIANRKSILNNLNEFDKILSFDKNDSKEFNFNFRPLFYSDKFQEKNEFPIQYELTFIGTIHSDRFNILKKIKENFPKELQLFFYCYIQAWWVFYFYKITNSCFKGARKEDFKFKGIDKATINQIFMKSKCILDIEHPMQNGLTMRTFEVLGAQKKLATTNREISEYDFYHEDNILIIDRKCPTISSEFLKRPFKKLDQSLLKKYSITGWLEEIFS